MKVMRLMCPSLILSSLGNMRVKKQMSLLFILLEYSQKYNKVKLEAKINVKKEGKKDIFDEESIESF